MMSCAHTALLKLGVLVAAGVTLMACGSAQKAASPSSPSPTSSPSSTVAQPDWKAQATALSALVARIGPSAWDREPRGDLPITRDATDLYFVKLLAVRDHGRVIVFDAAQYYQGDAAQRQARRDHTDAPSDFYIRNSHAHRQELPLAAGCPVAVRFTPEGYFTSASVRVISPSDLASAIADHSMTVTPWFWMLTDGRHVFGLIQHYIP